jgi:hypothetical protein
MGIDNKGELSKQETKEEGGTGREEVVSFKEAFAHSCTRCDSNHHLMNMYICFNCKVIYCNDCAMSEGFKRILIKKDEYGLDLPEDKYYKIVLKCPVCKDRKGCCQMCKREY